MRKEIIEESSKVLVDLDEAPSKDLDVFYNAEMKLNRTLSSLLLSTIENDILQIALPLAGSGVRAVRLLNELPENKIKLIHINDLNEKAYDLIQKNLELNKLNSTKKNTEIKVFNKDAIKFLEDSIGFDYIDIDPFGSPNFLLDVSLRRISRKGILAVTATDTGALNGAFPTAGRMKYWAETELVPQKHELGIRILARRVILEGLSQHKVLEPILSYHYKHYYRIFFKVTKSKTKASKYFNQVNKKYVVCKQCAFSKLNDEKIIECPICGNKKLSEIGPLFIGKLNDESLLKKLIKKNEETFNDEKITKLLTKLISEETIENIGFYDTHFVCEKNKLSIPKINDLIEKLREQNFLAEQSIFLKTAIKTNASFEDFLKTMKDLQ